MAGTILGVIGGMGPLATVAFLRGLTLETDAARDQDHLHVLIDSDPSIPDRTAFLLGAGPDPRPAMIEAARRLEHAGASVLVMPCNTANVFAADVERAVSVPLLPWVSIASSEALRGARRVGLLATDGTLTADLYQAAIADAGGSSIVPSRGAQRAVMAAIYGPQGVKATGFVPPSTRRRLVAAAHELRERGAERLLLACTELPLAMPADDPGWPIPAIDAGVAVAREVLRRAGLRLRGSERRRLT